MQGNLKEDRIYIQEKSLGSPYQNILPDQSSNIKKQKT